MSSRWKAILKSSALFSNALTISRRYKKECWNPDFSMGKVSYFLRTFPKSRVYTKGDKAEQYKRLFSNISVKLESDEFFFYSIDFYKKPGFRYRTLNNLTVDYKKILDCSIDEIKNQCELSENKNDIFIKTADDLKIYIDRIILSIDESNNSRKHELKNIFKSIKSNPCDSFEAALQRILFLNQLMWQVGHDLNGLGRLDTILYPFYAKDINCGIITQSAAEHMIEEFCKALHKFYYLKSGSLPGDTGQIIILGGKNTDGSLIDNELTHMFIREIKKLHLPDPKLLLRVSDEIDFALMKEATECIATGIGSPLLSNDDVVISKLLDFGIDKDDAYNYMTSACWEPLISGKSFDQNNQLCLNFAIPFITMLNKAELESLHSTDAILNEYDNYLRRYLADLANDLLNMRFEPDPAMSLFIGNCIETGLDVAQGGAKYNNFGLTSVGLANVTDSIINISRLVFKEKKYTLEELNNARKNNYDGYETMFSELIESSNTFGHDNSYTINIVNRVLDMADMYLKQYRTRFGGYIKFGCSSPSYISASNGVEATFDGRKNGDPFRVHISGKDNVAYTELISFASQLDYTGLKFNGNVVDFFVSPNLITYNLDKFVQFLNAAIKKGFFQVQMNVVSSSQLIEAKEHPEKYSNLIVRVWGFSAYFVDLPENYKDYLIQRAVEAEQA